MWLLCLWFCCFYVTSVNSQSVGTIVQIQQFNQSIAQTRCKQGLVENTDTLLFYGSVNTRNVNINSRRNVLFQHKPVNTASYKTICAVDLGNSTCATLENRRTCYCKENRSLILTLVMNVTATKSYSQSTVRLIWPLAASDSYDRSIEVLAPKIYGFEQTAFLVGQELQQISDRVVLNLRAFRTYNLTYCVRNLIAKDVSVWYENRQMATTKDDCVYWLFYFSTKEHGKTVKLEYNEMSECGRVGNVLVTLMGHSPSLLNANNTRVSKLLLMLSLFICLLDRAFMLS